MALKVQLDYKKFNGNVSKLAEKGFSVAEISEQLGISKQTFFGHYMESCRVTGTIPVSIVNKRASSERDWAIIKAGKTGTGKAMVPAKFLSQIGAVPGKSVDFTVQDVDGEQVVVVSLRQPDGKETTENDTKKKDDSE